MTGRIIFLNGSSSAGKTTLAHALQDALDEPWFHMALDQFRDGMPGRWRGMNAPPDTPGYDGLNVVPVKQNDAMLTEVRFGAVGQSMLIGMHRAIAVFADSGNNVIIDDLLLNTHILQDYLQVLANYWVLFVAVRCPLEVVNSRELARPGRFPGTAQSHYKAVHAHDCYDLEVDTSLDSPIDCVDKVLRYLASGVTPQAFRKLKQHGGP